MKHLIDKKKEHLRDLGRYVQYEPIFTSVCQPHRSYTTHQADVNYLQFTTKHTHDSTTICAGKSFYLSDRIINRQLTVSVPHFFWLWQKWVYQSVQCHTGLTHPFNFLTLRHSGTQDWEPECPNVKKLKGCVRPVWHWTLWSVTISDHWAWKG